MTNIEIKKLIDNNLKILGFKRKGSNWILEGNELTKIVNLQKSNFGNYYYINYGFIINGLDLNKFKAHIYDRYGSKDKIKNDRIERVLNLEEHIDDKERENDLLDILNELRERINAIDTEADLLNNLKHRTHLNDIPLMVKKYFHIN